MSGHLALASCTRFSPNTLWPAAMTSAMAAGGKVFEMATRVTVAGSRLAARQAASMSRRTAARAVAASVEATVDTGECGLAAGCCTVLPPLGPIYGHPVDRPWAFVS